MGNMVYLDPTDPAFGGFEPCLRGLYTKQARVQGKFSLAGAPALIADGPVATNDTCRSGVSVKASRRLASCPTWCAARTLQSHVVQNSYTSYTQNDYPKHTFA